MKLHTRKLKHLSLLLAVPLVLAACSGEEDTDEALIEEEEVEAEETETEDVVEEEELDKETRMEIAREKFNEDDLVITEDDVEILVTEETDTSLFEYETITYLNQYDSDLTTVDDALKKPGPIFLQLNLTPKIWPYNAMMFMKYEDQEIITKTGSGTRNDPYVADVKGEFYLRTDDKEDNEHEFYPPYAPFDYTYTIQYDETFGEVALISMTIEDEVYPVE